MSRQTNAQRREAKRRQLEEKRRLEARRRAVRTSVTAMAAVAVIGVGLFALWPRQSAEDIAAEETSNTTATAWDLPRLDGEGRVALADFRGKPTVAAFFANWCTVCEWEMPELLAFSEQVGDQINFVGIDMMDNGRGLGDAEKWGLVGRWPLARDVGNGNGSLLAAGAFGARGSPLNVLYSPEGQVVHVQPGAISPEQILELFAPYLQG